VFQELLRLDGQTVVVFGSGGGGMGTSTALAFAEAGATLIAIDLTEERIEDTKQRVAEVGGTCFGIAGDVRSADDIRTAFELADEHGGASGLVNLVGAMRLATRTSEDIPGSAWLSVDEVPDSVYADIMAINVEYVFRSCREFVTRALAREATGSIVNFASISAVAGAPYHSPYGIAKAGVMSLTRSLAVELGPKGVRANCIVPGSVPTPLAQSAAPTAFDNITDRASRKAPLGRRVKPDEIAGAVLFFLSDLSGGISGQCLNVDAGVSANSPLGTGAEYLETTLLRR